MKREEILHGLNEAQKEAVMHTEGPLLVVAGAGSGKTRVITQRIAYLLYEKDVWPYHILAITFTNKAAREMKERILKIVGETAEKLWLSTFHAFCVRVLRLEGSNIGLKPNFTIIDRSQQVSTVKRVLKDLKLNDKQKQLFTPSYCLNFISQAKNNLLDPPAFRDSLGEFVDTLRADIYDQYQGELSESASLDFDDLLMATVHLFQTHSEILGKYQRRFQYIHVDEYQDTNEAQYQLVKLLAGDMKNICVVGDADQSIYSWRGANMENLMHFEVDFPGAKVIKLEQNYRSTKRILAAANEVISHNKIRKDKRLWTENKTGELLTYYRASNDQKEAEYVSEQIATAKSQGIAYQDMAIFYRTNAQSRRFEENLRMQGIPYQLIGGLKFYDRKEIRDLIAYLTLFVNPADRLSFMRIINEPKRGMGARSIEKLESFAEQKGLSLLQASLCVADSPLTGKAKKAMAEFAMTYQNLNSKKMTMSLGDFIEAVLKEFHYEEAFSKESAIDREARMENLREFINAAREFSGEHLAYSQARVADFMRGLDQMREVDLSGRGPKEGAPVVNNLMDQSSEQADVTENILSESLEDFVLLQFLTDLSLMTDTDNEAEEDGEVVDRVNLMTLHAAKGLEFPIVFLVGLEEGIFPSAKSLEDPKAYEEERRLAYVGITRAREKLYLTNAASRWRYHSREFYPEARFIREISPEHLEVIDHRQMLGDEKSNRWLLADQLGPTPQERQEEAKRSIFNPQAKKLTAKTNTSWQWKIGDKAEHRVWGIGTVVMVKGSEQEQELTIAFKNQGLKKLLAAFAPITRVE